MRSDQFYALLCQPLIERITIVGAIPNKSLGSSQGNGFISVASARVTSCGLAEAVCPASGRPAAFAITMSFDLCPAWSFPRWPLFLGLLDALVFSHFNPHFYAGQNSGERLSLASLVPLNRCYLRPRTLQDTPMFFCVRTVMRQSKSRSAIGYANFFYSLH